jgi:hypothetical protein
VKFIIMQFSPWSCSQKPSVYIPPPKWEAKFRTYTAQPAKLQTKNTNVFLFGTQQNGFIRIKVNSRNGT